MNQKTKLLASCIGLTLALSPAYAQSLIFSTTAPTPGASDVYNFTPGLNDSGNVNGGADSATYVPMDQNVAQGQTFTTGNNAGGYTLNGFWFQHALYTTSQGNGTWWNVNTAGAQLTFRLTDPSAAGTGSFVLDSATYTITGAEPNNFGSNGGNANQVGTGTWMYFTFATPLTLAANTTYGLDLSAGTTPNFYFEMAGNIADAYAGGSAYTTTRGGNSPTTYTGDRVFDASLTPVPEPSTLALCGLGSLALLFRRRVKN